MQEEIIEDVFENYGYKRDQELLISAEFLLGVLSFCRRVQDSQPRMAALLQYPKTVNPIKDRETGELIRIDYAWENHTKQSFSNTAFEENGAVPIVTDLSMYALQIENALESIHIKNINEGIATKYEKDGAKV